MPTFSKSTIQENRKIFFNSEKANLTLSKSHLFYYLNEPIQVLAGHYLFLTLLDAYIPVSFYQQKDVIISGSIGASNFSFTITDGTYTANEMVNELNSQFTNAGLNCVVSYKQITNKFTFTSNQNITLNASSFLPQFGFTNETHSGSNTLTSNNVVDLMPLKNIYLKLQNMSVANYKDGETSKIMAKIPITSSRNGFIEYLAHSNISSEIFDRKIDTFEIIMCDENNEEIDFNGVPFTFSIGVVFETKLSYENSMKTNDEEINYLNNI